MTDTPTPLDGTLMAFWETGMEKGITWAFQEDGKDGYEGLHLLKNGDLLTVFNSASRKDPVWSGEVDLDYTVSRRAMPLGLPGTIQHIDGYANVDGIQKGVDPKTWARMFQAEKPARLIPKQ